MLSRIKFIFILQERELTVVKAVVSDGHGKIMNTVKESFLGSLWQYCNSHFIKNLRKAIRKEK